MSGSSSVRGDQTIYHTDNLCFDGTDRGSPMAVDGQLWIGATASNRADNGGHVRLGSLTSPNATITIGYAAPNITLDVAKGGMKWTDVTSATQTLAVQNGYVTDRGAGVTYTLPATATLGDVIKIDGKLGLTTIAQNANQAIRMGASISTTGVGGSVVGTNVGDCITLRCTTGGASTIWVAENWVGSFTVT